MLGLGGAGSVLRTFQIVFKAQDQEVAGAEAESGGFAAVGGEIAVARRAVGVGVVVDGEINLQDAVLAAEVFGFGDRAADGRARAGVGGEILREDTWTGVNETETGENC